MLSMARPPPSSVSSTTVMVTGSMQRIEADLSAAGLGMDGWQAHSVVTAALRPARCHARDVTAVMEPSSRSACTASTQPA